MCFVRLWLALSFALTTAACATRAAVQLQTLSTQPSLITGGDVLMGMRIPQAVDPHTVRISLRGIDVTPAFRDLLRPANVPQHWDRIGLIEGLRQGINVIHVSWRPNTWFAREAQATVQLTNHALTGPLISGPHEHPFACQTHDFTLPTGKLLGPAVDVNCSVRRRVDYGYVNAAGELAPWPQTGIRPADLVFTTTTEGQRVPLIVRFETGTVNRAIYQSAILHDPDTPAPSPWRRPSGWNGRLVYTHGGGCRRGWHRQGNKTGPMSQILLERGYAVTSSSLNVFGQNCNDLLASETHVMVKERFIEAYGVPLFTIGTGGSGGSYQSFQTADNYPGVFDGILVEDSFPDVATAAALVMSEARLLHHYFQDLAPGAFTLEQKLSVSGFANELSLVNHSANAARIVAAPESAGDHAFPGAEFDASVEERLRYSSENPAGARATLYDHTVNVYGKDPLTGKAGRPLDNVGVQYGLQALNQAAISWDQFLDLNERVGGFDEDGRLQPQRTTADPHALRRAYETGRVLYGGGGLAYTPVVDLREYRDDSSLGDIHTYINSFSVRARLAAANGHTDNHVIMVYPDDAPAPQAEAPPQRVTSKLEQDARFLQAFSLLDHWLTNIAQDQSQRTAVEKLRLARPAELADKCWVRKQDVLVPVIQRLTASPQQPLSECAKAFVVHLTPRNVAGGPISNDVIQCARKALDLNDYALPPSPTQLERLQQIFPNGVCDWNKSAKPAYGGTWQRLPVDSAGVGQTNKAPTTKTPQP